MIDNSQTKNIEIAIEAFRTIKKAVQEYGFCPRDLKATPLDEEDMDNPILRQRLRNNFEEYANLYYAIHNEVLPALTNSMRNIESEYNYLMINSRNLKKALDLFTSNISEALFDYESVWKKSGCEKLFIVPLRTHSIISSEEADTYYQMLNEIGWNYSQAAIHIRNVFKIKQPWSTPEWEKNRKSLEDIINGNEDDSQNGSIEVLTNYNEDNDFRHKKSFSLKAGKEIPFDKVYRLLIDSNTIKDMDEKYFINCITHAHFKPMWEKGIHINILYVIRRLEDYYGKEWRLSVCESIGIESRRVTQDPPTTDFKDRFDAVLKGQNPD